MIEFSLGDYAALATIAGTLGAGVVFTSKYLSRKNRPDKSSAENLINHEGIQIVAKAGGILNINGGVNNNINQPSKRIPDALAKPSINIQQVGFSNGGSPHKTSYELEATNFGGDFFSLKVVFLNSTILSTPSLPRGRRVNFTLDLNDRPKHIEIVFSGINKNGEEVSIPLSGTLIGPTQSKYVFQEYIRNSSA